MSAKPGTENLTKSQLVVDLDVIHAAIIKSKGTQELLQKVADDIVAAASASAASTANEEGDYSRSFRGAVLSAGKLRAIANKKTKTGQGEAGPGVNRRKRGQRNEHRYLDTFIITNGTYNLKNRMVDPDFKVYEGLVAFVGNYDWKAVWVEYGTLAMRGRYILVNAAERVAKQYGAEFEIMYTPTRVVNRKELGRRISKGLLKNRVNKRAAEYRTGSKG